MIPVKWVLEKDIFASYAKIAEYQERDNIAAPVVELSALTEVVEELIEQEKTGLNHAQYIMALQDLRTRIEEDRA